MPHKIQFELDIYTYQIDFLGHVSNIVYLEWTEIARLKLMAAVGMPIPTLMEQGIAPILVESQISYKKPYHLGDRVFVELWLSEFNRLTVQMCTCFYHQDGAIAAQASQKGIFIHLGTRKPRRLSQAQIAVFQPYLATSVQTHSRTE
ncbi:MAG: thioesterase family protein [Pseudanabaenaceae cyanobacterium bins.68]|nr:thioesterase family protein [Pseudanabaenaceae cyanobacterium bins.68]